MIYLQIGKTYIAKTPPSDFKVTILKNSLLSQQAVTSKGILVPYTNLQLNPYPNTQLDLFCSDSLSFQCTAPSMRLTNSMRGSQYATNQFDVRILVRVLHTNLRRMLAAKFFSSSHDEDHETSWLQNPMVYKHSSFLNRKMN